MLVPYAMAAFGIIVTGVGTIHASMSGYEIAATLQHIATVLVTKEAIITGAVAGFACSRYLNRNRH